MILVILVLFSSNNYVIFAKNGNNKAIDFSFCENQNDAAIQKEIPNEPSDEIVEKIVEQFEYISYDYNDPCHVSVVRFSDVPRIWYFYDKQDQLIRENNKVLNKTITYSYDFRGNIRNKKIYPFASNTLEKQISEKTTKYKYADHDRMIAYDGQKITYDPFGNPIQYRDGWKFEWNNDHQLSKAVTLNNNIQYDYSDDGYRTHKIVNGKITEFVYEGTRIISQKSVDGVINWYSEELASFNYNGADYIYIRNIPGDVVGIADDSGKIVANYTYDSWGSLISITNDNGEDVTNDTSHIGYINPLRYRGYYYDSETKLYYLLSRYYDPETGRFLSEGQRAFLSKWF